MNSQAIDLRSRGIDKEQASDLRARLKTFAEDWERPEAATARKPLSSRFAKSSGLLPSYADD